MGRSVWGGFCESSGDAHCYVGRVDRKHCEVTFTPSVENGEVLFRQTGNGSAMAVADYHLQLNELAHGAKNGPWFIRAAAEANFAWRKSLRGSEHGVEAKHQNHGENRGSGALGW